jgi:hypothetical protein
VGSLTPAFDESPQSARTKPRKKSDSVPAKKRKSDEHTSTAAERRKKKGKIDGYFTKEE